MKSIDKVIDNLCKCIELTNKEKIKYIGIDKQLENKLQKQSIFIAKTIDRLRKISSQFDFIKW